MMITIRRDLRWMQALFLFFSLTLYKSVKANEHQLLTHKLKKIFTDAQHKKDFSKEYTQLNTLSEQEKKALLVVWESPAYPWKWRWLSVMYMAEHMMPEAEKIIIQGLQDPLFLIRLASIKALASQTDLKTYHPYLISCLKDDSLVVRKAAIQALSVQPSQKVIQAIEKAMFDDKNRLQNEQDLMGILKSMLDVIVQYNDKQSIHTLAKLIQRTNMQSQFKIHVCNAFKSLVENNALSIKKSNFDQQSDCAYHWQRWYTKHQSSI
ncbi:HEAT repeat domain-containing protein [bacterium]|nr:HEAT repeat domain-containing protein [bacterium]